MDITKGPYKGVAATYSPGNDPSTIGAAGLNFSVRDGKRWDPCAGPPKSSHGSPCIVPVAAVPLTGTVTDMFSAETVQSVQVFGQLVPLGYDIAAFTPVAYQRHRL